MVDQYGHQHLYRLRFGATPPAQNEPGILWLDTSSTPPIPRLYDGSAWSAVTIPPSSAAAAGSMSAAHYSKLQALSDIRSVVAPLTLAGNTLGADLGLVLLGETILTAAAATIQFTGIPQIYRHLLGFFAGHSTAAVSEEGFQFQANGDTGANYQYQGLSAVGASVAGGEALAQNVIRLGAVPGTLSGAAHTPGGMFVIPNYTNTTYYKTVLLVSGRSRDVVAGGMSIQQTIGFWLNQAAITSVLFKAATGNLEIGTRISLYGVR